MELPREGRSSAEPEIGLEYILECRSSPKATLWAECQLCNCELGRQVSSKSVFLAGYLKRRDVDKHVVGYTHRLAYFKKHHPEMVVGYLSHKKLKQMAAEVVARDGRKKIRLVSKNYARAGSNKNQSINRSSDKRLHDPPSPPKAVPPSASLQELKKAHAEDVKKTTLDVSVDGFGTKKEIFDYLSQYQIRCEDDAAFVLKVTKNFRQSLVNYREVKEQAAGAAAYSVTYPPQQQVHPTGQNIYAACPPRNMPGQQSLSSFDDNIYSLYPPKYKPVQQAPVSRPPTSVYNSGPPAFNTANTMALPGGPGPRQETNKATIEFFTNIQNLHPEEMSAILHKIAATKPAFRDMDIPNVIKTLCERGNLKPSNKGSSQY